MANFFLVTPTIKMANHPPVSTNHWSGRATPRAPSDPYQIFSDYSTLARNVTKPEQANFDIFLPNPDTGTLPVTPREIE
jgi:hypothetical protein